MEMVSGILNLREKFNNNQLNQPKTMHYLKNQSITITLVIFCVSCIKINSIFKIPKKSILKTNYLPLNT